MNIKIGAIIKNLRQEHHITQEALAAAIGVTPQAISRWESAGGYPDIELLPALADFFSVSTDELLGYRLSEREQELADIKAKIDRLAEDGSLEERLSLARIAHSKYPGDYEIRYNLAVCLYHLWDENHTAELFDEMETLCSSVIAECRDEDTRYDAIFLLACLYGNTEQSERALETVNLLAPLKYCREFVKSEGIGDGNTEYYVQDEIDKLTDCLGTAITNYTLHEDLPNDASTWERKIEMLGISNQLYRMIYGDNLMFYHVRLSRNDWLISTFQMALGQTEEALASLEKMKDHAIAYDLSYINNHGKYYTSILTNKIVYPEPGSDFHELTEHTDCHYMLEKLRHPRYDAIRQHPRFLSVMEEMTPHAK